MVEPDKKAELGPKIDVTDLRFWYGSDQVLFGIDMKVPARSVTSLIGPSGCGKTTLLLSINRMNEVFDGARVEGSIRIDGQEIYGPDIDVATLRRNVGMVFQESNPFPKSVFDNIAYGPRVHGVRSREKLSEIVERSLRQVAMWDEVKDRLGRSALELSGGQQQRLCIARTLAVGPEIILMDEPASALDARSTVRIEDLIGELRATYTIVMVTHNMQQAARVSDYTAFLYEGRMIEFGKTTRLFSNPREKQTESYITGRFH